MLYNSFINTFLMTHYSLYTCLHSFFFLLMVYIYIGRKKWRACNAFHLLECPEKVFHWYARSQTQQIPEGPGHFPSVKENFSQVDPQKTSSDFGPSPKANIQINSNFCSEIQIKEHRVGGRGNGKFPWQNLREAGLRDGNFSRACGLKTLN